MVCFTNGHPHEDIATLEKRGPLEAEIARVVRGLCPELHSGNMVNFYFLNWSFQKIVS